MRYQAWRPLLAALSFLLTMSGPAAEVEKIDAAQAAAIAGDPAFTYRPQRLVDIPAPTGPAINLFNGRNLEGWDSWLGYADPSHTFKPDPAPTYGLNQDRFGIFNVVMEDGAPALFITGKIWGGIVHQGLYGDYHLRLEYKWGRERHAPRADKPQNNGLLYHSHGAPGAVFGSWMAAVEFEIMLGSVGMVVPVGTHVGIQTKAGHDPSIIYPQRRYMPGGKEVSVAQPAWNVEAAMDAEKPAGQWNVLDLYVLGDRAIHVVNGVPVMEVWGLSRRDTADGKPVPLTQGHIQLQSEGADTYFRNITLEPIRSLPRLVAP
ncbi:DUF1080 domain-containing protein [Niveispirillum sp. SYP-B3756]|uniref:3-keto-disaccharide hydrolase n=1 Tax=Niveispirillum sp. SYP-B3756 TaxID=2662178 RepID=UPI001B3BF117|nr:DUF1080 domain-containing protein [Niveispirillum sp. SYP-B3756]